MNESEHRVGVEEINLVVRNLKLCDVNNDNKRPMLDEIDSVLGVDAVSFYQEKTLYILLMMQLMSTLIALKLLSKNMSLNSITIGGLE